MNTHYRKKLNFTFESLDASQTAYNRLLSALAVHKKSTDVTDTAIIEKYKKEFLDAINDDINLPLAMGVLWTMIKEKPSKDIFALALEFDKVFGLNLKDAKEEEKKEEQIEVPADIKAIAEERWQARKDKNWAKSDELRAVLLSKGYVVVDSKDGYTIKLA